MEAKENSAREKGEKDKSARDVLAQIAKKPELREVAKEPVETLKMNEERFY
jgi:hypothetical protein